ncbi:centrosomal protein of 97 kDa isoform X1 [Phlebotomus papatasi]|nr:centrosomal protein of 97 kDa isoform X1 [Phlebotomus papatasi]
MTKLTEEMVIARTRQSDLSTVKKLNCWGSELTDVSIIRRMRGVEVLALSVNKISSLADFENCQNLQELYLRRNNIKDLSELAYLQSLPNLKYLWIEENPCVERAGPSYRAIVLRTLPNLLKLDNIEVTPEELADARRGSVKRDDVIYEDSSYNETPSSQNQQQSQYRQQSPMRENQSLENTEESISDPIDRNSIPSSPIQRSPSNQEQYSPPETNQPPSPRYQRDHRGSYNQYDVSMRSPGSDQEASPATGYRDRVPIAPSMSTHSMKEYYQSDYQKPHPAQYRHSQMDLTEWDEHQQQHHQGGHPGRRNGGTEAPRDPYAYRNGNANREEWDDNVEVRRRERRSEGRFNDSASVVSNAVLNHYASYHRRPVNRNANLLSATLCLVKELDYPSLEVVEHAVRCRIDELATD